MKLTRVLVPIFLIVPLVFWMMSRTSRVDPPVPIIEEGAPVAAAPPRPTSARADSPPSAVPGAPAGAAGAGPVDKHGEPLMTEGKFAGFTRNHWREHYTRTIEEKERDLAETRKLVDDSDKQPPLDPQELKIARMRIENLVRTLEVARQELDELSRAR
jgi:hypothetical protein